jgi:hypothetical protein
MPMIMITCPVTKKPVPTGMNWPEEFFKTANIRDSTMKCPACGHVHHWSKKDAFMQTPEAKAPEAKE